MKKIVPWTALAVLLAAAAPAPTAAQIGGLIKKKVKEKVVQTVGGNDTGSAASATSPTAKGARVAPPAHGPVFTENVLEITSALLDQLEKGLAAGAAAREENARQLGKVLPREQYEQCQQGVLTGPEGRKLSEESLRLMDESKTQEQLQQAMLELAKRLDAITEPKCGLEPQKAEQLRSKLADRPAAAAQEASGLTRIQLSILKERVLPLCSAAGLTAPAGEQLRIATEAAAIFWVYSPGEVEALRPRCDRLLEALRADD